MERSDHIAFVVCKHDRLKNKARALSEYLGVDLREEPNRTDVGKYLNCGRDYYIEFKDALVCLKSLDHKKHGPIFSDFSCKSLEYRRLSRGVKQEAIARAVGVSGNYRPDVIDLTAGMGDDAFILASLGCNVTLVERNPVVFSLLENGFDRAQSYDALNIDIREIVKRMRIVFMDGSTFLNIDSVSADVIYLDPMYQKRRKSSAVRKEMQAFHSIIGTDEDAPNLVSVALKKARYRVVVKRPLRAEYLSNSEPSFSIKGKTTRFDIFVLPRFQK